MCVCSCNHVVWLCLKLRHHQAMKRYAVLCCLPCIARTALVQVCDRVNGEALATGMVWVMTIPWTACACLYGVLHFTYPRDRRRVLARIGADGEDGALAGLARGAARENEKGAGWDESGGSSAAADPCSSSSSCCCCCGGGGGAGSSRRREEYTPLKGTDTI